jgi:hypothetical protein
VGSCGDFWRFLNSFFFKQGICYRISLFQNIFHKMTKIPEKKTRRPTEPLPDLPLAGFTLSPEPVSERDAGFTPGPEPVHERAAGFTLGRNQYAKEPLVSHMGQNEYTKELPVSHSGQTSTRKSR